MKDARAIKAFLSALVMSGLVTLTAVAGQPPLQPPEGAPRGSGPRVYVTGQDLVYDTIVLGILPMQGDFQQLEMTGPTGLQTEFGPGDPGYLGGRWWVDVNLNGVMDEGDTYFLCPLMGDGYTLD